MSELYGDRYDSVTGGPDRLFSETLRRSLGAALFIGLVGAMGYWAYSLGTRDAADVPIIRAMEGPSRIQPVDPGGLTAAHQGLEVNAVLAGVPAPEPRVDAPVAPAPVLLTPEDGPQGELVLAAPVALAVPEETDALRMPLGEDVAPGGIAPALEALAPETVAPETPATPSLEDAIAAAILAEAAGNGAVTPTQAATAVEAAASGTRPMRRPSNLVVARANLAPSETPTVAPLLREVASVPEGARLVQLGAYDSEALTREAWSRLVAAHGDLLADKSLFVERTTSNARVFYRLRVAGFAGTAQSGALCEALRARGVDCIPVTRQ